MIKVFKAWMERYLSDPEAILLLVLLLGGLGIVLSFGHVLMPVFVSIAITALLQFWMSLLEKYNCPYILAYSIVYLVFLTLFLASIFFLLPLLWKQGANFIGELPVILKSGKGVLLNFIESRQDFVSAKYLNNVTTGALDEIQLWGKKAISLSISSIPEILTWVVYIILVPLLVFFLLKDQRKIMDWFVSFLPEKRGLIRKIWHEMNDQMGNYVRGKIAEIVIVAVCTYSIFIYCGLHYAALLASLVGLSVVIPFVGVIVVTIPVMLVGYFQWGFAGGLSGELAIMLYAYSIVQLIDGSLLVPLLLSEAVNLHPLAIIIAILFFGTIWGFWGVFFAIPLATLVKSVINAWPRNITDKQF